MALMTFPAKLVRVRQISSDVYHYYFTRPEDFTFLAGQFVNIKLTKDNETKFRAYSILNNPSDKKHIELLVKILPEGFGSGVFRELKTGDELEMKGPFGHLVLDENAEEHWMIATGTGLAPFYSMLKESLSRLKDKKFTLIFGVRKKEGLLLHEELTALEKAHSNFTYIPTLSEDTWDKAHGRVQKHIPSDISNKTFYVCGLMEMVLETESVLLSRGVLRDNIKKERYS